MPRTHVRDQKLLCHITSGNLKIARVTNNSWSQTILGQISFCKFKFCIISILILPVVVISNLISDVVFIYNDHNPLKSSNEGAMQDEFGVCRICYCFKNIGLCQYLKHK